MRWPDSGNVLGSDTAHNFPGLAEIHATREARERAMVEAAREAARREAAQEQVATLKADLKVKIEEHRRKCVRCQLNKTGVSRLSPFLASSKLFQL